MLITGEVIGCLGDLLEDFKEWVDEVTGGRIDKSDMAWDFIDTGVELAEGIWDGVNWLNEVTWDAWNSVDPRLRNGVVWALLGGMAAASAPVVVPAVVVSLAIGGFVAGVVTTDPPAENSP